jgi:hypothetical protein
MITSALRSPRGYQPTLLGARERTTGSLGLVSSSWTALSLVPTVTHITYPLLNLLPLDCVLGASSVLARPYLAVRPRLCQGLRKVQQL